jgi:hypothetical protein
MVKSIMSQKALRIIYFSYVHSTTIYGIIFGAICHILLKFSELKKDNKNYYKLKEQGFM